MKGWAEVVCFVALLGLALAKPIVDPGLFVIQGVASCGDGNGYCMLGSNCTFDIDFLPDDNEGHCEGLMDAFTPKISFVCCRYNPLGKETSVPPTTTLSPVTVTGIFDVIDEEAPNPDDYDELPEDFNPEDVVDVVGVVTDFTGVIGLITQPWTGTFPTRSTTTPTPPSSSTTASTASTTTPATTSPTPTIVNQVTPQPEETTEQVATSAQETQPSSSATESYNDMLTVLDESQQQDSRDPVTPSVPSVGEVITEEAIDADIENGKPNRTDIVFPSDSPNTELPVFLPSKPLVSNKPIVELEEEEITFPDDPLLQENQVEHTENLNEEHTHVEEEEKEKEDLLLAEALHEGVDSSSVINLENNNIEVNTPLVTTESQVDISSTEISNIAEGEGLEDNNIQEDQRTTLREERTDRTTEIPVGPKVTTEGSVEFNDLQNTEEGNEDKNAEHSATALPEMMMANAGGAEADEIETGEETTTTLDEIAMITDRPTEHIEETTTVIEGTAHGNEGSPSLVGHGSYTVLETAVAGAFDGETIAPNEESDNIAVGDSADGQSGVMSASQTESADTGAEAETENIASAVEEGNIDTVETEATTAAETGTTAAVYLGTSPLPDAPSVSSDEEVPVHGLETETGETGITANVVMETTVEDTRTESALETGTTEADAIESTTESDTASATEEAGSDVEPVTSSIYVTSDDLGDTEVGIHGNDNKVTEGETTEEVSEDTTTHEDVTDNNNVEDQHDEHSIGYETVIEQQAGGTRPEEDIIDQQVEETIAEEDFIDQQAGGTIEEINVIDHQVEGPIGDDDAIHQQVDNVIGNVGVINQQVESVIDDENIINQQVEEDNLIGDAPPPPAVEQQRPLQPVNQNVCGFKKYREPDADNFVSRILGGTQATMIKWCWMAAIVEKNYGGDKYVCTGALVEPNLVMTTAACLSRIESRGLEAYRVVLGDSNLLNELPYEVQFYDITEAVPHPSYLTSGGAHANDIGLIRLNSHAMLTDTVCLVCLAQQDADFATNSECYVTGYGQSRPALNGYSDVHDPVIKDGEGILRELKVPLLEEGKCSSALRNITGSDMLAQSNFFLCAGGLGEDGACYRTLDGGSPLTCRVHGRWYLAGLVSWSRDCTRPGVPNIYTRVSSYSNWVQANYLRMLGFVTHQVRLA